MAPRIMFSSNPTVPIKQSSNNTLNTTDSSFAGGNGRLMFPHKRLGGNLFKRCLRLMKSHVISPTVSTFKISNILPKEEDDEEEEESSKTEEVTAVGGGELRLADVWKEIQGSNGWDDLLNPLDPLLLTEIVRYGEFVNVCYKTFDLDPKSKRYLNCKYGKRTVFRDVGLTARVLNEYDVTKYIYATSPTNNSRWIGYIAVSADSAVQQLGRRDILVSFRGTVTNAEWYANLMSSLTPSRLDPHDPRPDVMVESGFLSIYTSTDTQTSRLGDRSCREQLLCEITRLVSIYKDDDEEISITLAGHSMGSSLAILLGYDLAELGLNVVVSGTKKEQQKKKRIPITVYSFAGPRVGNLEFKNRCDELGVKVLRVVNVNDPITKLPAAGVFGFEVELPWMSSSTNSYTHVGVELSLDFFKMRDPSCVHDLQHLINGLMTKKNIVSKQEGEEIKQWTDGIMTMDYQVLSTVFQSYYFLQDAAANVFDMVRSGGFSLLCISCLLYLTRDIYVTRAFLNIMCCLLLYIHTHH